MENDTALCTSAHIFTGIANTSRNTSRPKGGSSLLEIRASLYINHFTILMTHVPLIFVLQETSDF